MSNFLQAKSGNYSSGRTDKVKYLVIHFTANNGDTAKGNANYFHNNTVMASAHYFVDEKEVWQSVRDSDTAYHCGAKAYRHGKCRNKNSIGIEMCSRKNSTGKYYFKDETVTRAIKLAKEIMAKYNIPIENVLRHWDVTGKNCPAPFVEHGTAWTAFKKALQEDEEMVKTIKIKLNGKVKTVNVIEKDGYNYVQLQDLRDGKIEVGYDGMPVINSK